MSNHLRELIDFAQWKNGGGIFLSRSLRSFIHAAGGETKKIVGAYERLQEAICFYAGRYEEGEKLRPEMSLARLPYPVTWFEFDNSGGYIVGVLGVDCGDGVFTLSAFERDLDKDWILVGVEQFTQGSSDYGTTASGEFDKDDDLLHAYCLIAIQFIGLLNCSNINRIEHKPSEKLQKARAKRGKKPLFSYWTLEIDLPKSRAVGEDYGGTHASPRLHLRRGHPRQYAPGKWCWVQPHVVGNKAAGMVHKDYAAKYAHA